MGNGYEEQIKEIMRARKPKGFYKGYHQLEAVLIEGCRIGREITIWINQYIQKQQNDLTVRRRT